MATALAVRRSAREAKAVSESKSLNDMGIYYIPDESDAMKGTAMLVGKEGTPYVGGFYFFDVQFPDDYPFSPMKVKSLTQDGKTRFNPNLYTCGKVCLSILNTWNGPSWNVVHTLETVLISIMSMVLNEYPIANEPGYESQIKTKTSDDYNRIVFHANVKTAILEMITSTPKFAVPFKEQMNKELEKNKSVIQNELIKELEHNGKRISGAMFGLSCNYEFGKLLSNPLLKKEGFEIKELEVSDKPSGTGGLPGLPGLPTLGLGKIVKDEEKKNVSVNIPSAPLPDLPELPTHPTLGSGKIVKDEEKKEVLEYISLPPLSAYWTPSGLPKLPKIVTAPKLVLKKHPNLDKDNLISDNSDCKGLIFKYDRADKTVWCVGKIFIDSVSGDVPVGACLNPLDVTDFQTLKKYAIEYLGF
jgi:ubiquitin-protein ligase